MPQSSTLDPIEKKELEIEKKSPEIKTIEKKRDDAESGQAPENPSDVLAETKSEKKEEVSEKIEAVRKAVGAQKAAQHANVASDAQSVSEIQEFEKKVEKLVEVAVQKGPEHAIRVAQHMDKGKDPSQSDNYTLDAIHDRLLEDEVRSQLIHKGLLKEL